LTVSGNKRTLIHAVDILAELQGSYDKIDKLAIEACLKEELKMQHEGQKRYDYYSLKLSQGEETYKFSRNGKPYRFMVEAFLSEEEIKRRAGSRQKNGEINFIILLHRQKHGNSRNRN
jgi:hypothetical protein